MFKRSCAVAIATCAISSSFAASSHAEWKAKQDGDVCYAMLRPAATKNAPPKRGAVYVALVHNKAEHTYDSLTFVSGYPDVSKSSPTVEIDGKSLDLLPYGRAAYARAGAPEQGLVSSMLAGGTMRVLWRSFNGDTTIVDDYDLAGIQKARSMIDVACNRSANNGQEQALQQAPQQPAEQQTDAGPASLPVETLPVTQTAIRPSVLLITPMASAGR